VSEPEPEATPEPEDTDASATTAGTGAKWDFIKKMGRGINVGNVLDARSGEGTWRPQAKAHFFTDIKAAGMTHVRIPITWRHYMSTTGAIDGIWTDDDSGRTLTFMDRVEEVVGWALDAGLVAVINSHHDDWLCASYDENKDRFDTLWDAIIERFKDASENLVFEIINEPFYTKYTVEQASSPEWPLPPPTTFNQDTVCSVEQMADLNSRILHKIREGGGNNADR
jgi:endoglucanase